MRPFLLLLSLVVHAQPARWVVCYSDEVRVEALAAYDLIVLDSRYHPPYFVAVQHDGLVRGENPNWKGSSFVDWRDPRWERPVLNDLVPFVLRSGFGGPMLKPVRNRGRKDTALRLIREIRRNCPAIRSILNRGFFLLDGAAPGIGNIYELERQNEFAPDVSAVELDKVIAEAGRTP